LEWRHVRGRTGRIGVCRIGFPSPWLRLGVYGLLLRCELEDISSRLLYILVSRTRLLGRSWDGGCGACSLAMRRPSSKSTTLAASWRSHDFQRKVHKQFEVYIFGFLFKFHQHSAGIFRRLNATQVYLCIQYNTFYRTTSPARESSLGLLGSLKIGSGRSVHLDRPVDLHYKQPTCEEADGTW
jgi:hypothetical protein